MTGNEHIVLGLMRMAKGAAAAAFNALKVNRFTVCSCLEDLVPDGSIRTDHSLMRMETMNKVALWIGVLFTVFAVVVFLFADGLRRWYSGIFFAVLGIATLWGAWRARGGTEK